MTTYLTLDCALRAETDPSVIEQQFLWTNYAWFWNNNQTALAMCAQLGLDPAIILAPDPYLT